MTKLGKYAAIIARLEAGERGPDIDMAIAKARGLVPADAEWGHGDETPEGMSAVLVAAFHKAAGHWCTPAYRQHREATRAFLAGRPSAEAVAKWVKDNPVPGWDDVATAARVAPLGTLRTYSGSLGAAMTLVPPNRPNGMRCRVILERKPTQDADWWIAEVRHHAEDGGDAVANTAAAALAIACLKAEDAAR